jgi:HTH-type transcriptional regulator/antitoxin HipB
MAIIYPIRFADQLRQHLRALRKRHRLTQAKLGQLLGVSQARIAEIEANPGLVNLGQLLQVFSALGATLSLAENQPIPGVEESPHFANRIGENKIAPSPELPSAQAGAQQYYKRSVGPGYSVNMPTANWQVHPIRSGTDNQVAREPIAHGEPEGRSTLGAKSDKATGSKAPSKGKLNRKSDMQPASKRNFTVRPKKGSW